MNCDPRLACLYFALVAIVLILILMQVWKVGYFRTDGNTAGNTTNTITERLKVLAPNGMGRENLKVLAPNGMGRENLKVLAPNGMGRENLKVLAPNGMGRENLKVLAPNGMGRERMEGNRACPNQALCEFMNPNAVIDTTLGATDASLVAIAQG